MKYMKLEDQVCFPIYALSRQVMALYRPLLDPHDLTYPQYLVLMLLWEHGSLSVKDIGERLLLDSGTLTPLLKRLEQKGHLTRERSAEDERVVVITISKQGRELQKKLQEVPKHFIEGMCISIKDAEKLKKQLYELMNQIQQFQSNP